MRIRIIILSLLLSFTLSAQIPFGFWGGSTTAALTSLFANHNSLELNGTNQYASVADAADLSFGDGATDSPFSLSAWVYMETPTDPMFVMAKSNSTSDREWYFIGSAGVFYIYIADVNNSNSRSRRIVLTSADVAGGWHHVAGTYNGNASSYTDLNIYWDGVLRNDGFGDAGSYVAMHNLSIPVEIGALSNHTYFTDGKIDQAVVWDKELSLSEVKEAMALRDLEYHSAYANIVSWWEFDDADVSGTTVDDRVGANNATMVNAPTRPQAIPYPYSYQLYASATYDSLTLMQEDLATAFSGFLWDFDGVNEYIDVADTDDLSFGNGTIDSPFSISAWINMDDATDFGIAGKYTAVTKEYLFWSAGGDKLNFQLVDNSTGGTLYVADNTVITYLQNQWIHVVATYDGSGLDSGMSIYLNKERVNDVVASSGTYVAMENTTVPFRIANFSGKYANGKIEDAQIFNKELSQAEVTELYKEHGLIDPRDTDFSANIVAYWNGYNSGSGSGAVDLSGNGNNGTLTNMSTSNIIYDSPRQIFEADSSGSFTFDGVNQYATVADNATLSFTDDSTYMSAFINIADATSFPIFSKAYEYLFWVNASDKLEARFIDSSSAGYIGRIYNTAITANQGDWIFVEATFDGTNVDIRLNGATVDDTDANSGAFTSMENTSNPLYIGYDGTNYADGSFSLSAIGDTPADLCEGQEAYNDGSPIDPRLSTFSASMVSAWRFNQGDSPTATDGILDIVGSNPATGVNTPTISTTSYPTN